MSTEIELTDEGTNEQETGSIDCPSTTPCYAKMVETLKEMTAVQCNDGNWNYDAYMHGMANGMIFALSLFEGSQPEFLPPPETWVKDTPNNEKPVCVTE